MTYSSMVERIAHIWDAELKASGNDELTEYGEGKIYGMIKTLAMMECVPYVDVRDDVIKAAHNVGRLMTVKA